MTANHSRPPTGFPVPIAPPTRPSTDQARAAHTAAASLKNLERLAQRIFIAAVVVAVATSVTAAWCLVTEYRVQKVQAGIAEAQANFVKDIDRLKTNIGR